MHTPPSTRTRDDANKELHEIELKINEEKNALEKINRERTQAESGFEKREKDHERKVAKSVVEAEHLDLKKTLLEDEINDLEAEKVSKNSEISRQNEVLLRKEREIKDAKKEVLDITDESIKAQNDRNFVVGTIDEILTKKREELVDAEKGILVQRDLEEQLKKKVLKKKLEFEKREAELKAGEIALEKRKSTLRTLSVRLNRKYGSLMKPGEKFQTKIQ